MPAYCSSSLPQMPQASTRSSALSSSISGIGSSRSSSVRAAVCTIARDVFMAWILVRDWGSVKKEH